MDNDKLKELLFKLVDIEPTIVTYQGEWNLGDGTVTIDTYDNINETRFIIGFRKKGNFTTVTKEIEGLSKKECLEIKLKLIDSKERYEETMLDTLLKLTGSATLNNQMDCLLEETEYEKEQKKHE